MNIPTAISNAYAQGGIYQNRYASTTAVTPSELKQSDEFKTIDRSGEVDRSGALTAAARKNDALDGAEKSGQDQNQASPGAQESGNAGADSAQLTQEEMQLVYELKQIDSQVRNHEMAHIAAGGSYITSGASYTYQKGPDGKSYAVGGEVSIDSAPVPGDPEATIQKMNQVRRAALAPGDPSPQDRKVAANASAQALKAMSELTIQQAKERTEQNDTQVFGDRRKEAADTYSQVSALPETETSSFQIAV
ncbi:MAG: SprA-related family protein [Desulfobacter sp.]|nr:MAG: SprA-related family protein [Desulfobacter sp.]